MAMALPIPRLRRQSIPASMYATPRLSRVGAVADASPAERAAAIALITVVIALPAVGAVIGYKLAGGGLVGLLGGAAGAIALPVGTAWVLRSALEPHDRVPPG